MELYKKYRPKKLSKMIGNEETVSALKNMLKKKTLPHTILFSGPSGCGKTTLARILRRELNCNAMDWTELNCSSSRGIDTIRDIIKHMKLAPTGGSVRIWLLDEVHQLSKDAQHSSLKMLEDTPAHVYFFLCTTEPQKLLKTIRTRCCDMPVVLLKDKQTTKLIKRVMRQESLKISDDVLLDLVEAGAGSARQTLVWLDKIANLPESEQANALKQPLEGQESTLRLCQALFDRKGASWPKVRKCLLGLTDESERIRWAVLGYATSILYKTKSQIAYDVICAFENNFYDTKRAGLVRACYEVVFGDN